ncbi:MAG: hypothetical protein Q8L86_11055 [Vicinamibacterales bacterium]|nr:hypothetical protein [Vicinamibacterales bacterium]
MAAFVVAPPPTEASIAGMVVDGEVGDGMFEHAPVTNDANTTANAADFLI